MNLGAMTQIQAAALLSIAPRTMRDWVDAPRNDDGTYPGPALVAYYVAKLCNSGDSEFDDQRQRLAAAQAEKVEHDNAVRRGDLAERAAVERFWTDCIANARAKALAMPSKLSARLVNIGDENIISAAIRAEVYALLAELADYEPHDGEPAGVVSETGERVDPSTRPDRQPVGRSRKKAQQRKQRRTRAMED